MTCNSVADIKIHFALKEPHARLFRPTDTNKLLVVTYAWDGNALPGLSITLQLLGPRAAISTGNL